MFWKSSLNIFSIFTMSLCWYIDMNHQHTRASLILLLEACPWHKSKRKKKKSFQIQIVSFQFLQQNLWFIMSNAFWRSISIIPFRKPSSTFFKILPVKSAKHRFVEWFGLNSDWKLYKILFSEINLFVWSWTILKITLEMIRSKELGL